MRIVKARFYIMDQYGYLTSVSIRKYNLFQPLPSCYWSIYFVPQYFPMVIINCHIKATHRSQSLYVTRNTIFCSASHRCSTRLSSPILGLYLMLLAEHWHSGRLSMEKIHFLEEIV